MAILIIEDNVPLHEMMKETLHQAGFTTQSAYSGSEAKLLSEQQTFDVILLDLMLPGLSGEDYLRWLRANHATPVLVISAIEDVIQKINLLEAGANDYLVKPFDLAELIARIKVQLRQEDEPIKSIITARSA